MYKDKITGEIKSNYEECNGCPYYYGEIDSCMYGEEDVPLDMRKKCEDTMNQRN